jgi:ribonucleoside-diphosphate reductase alpha chain
VVENRQGSDLAPDPKSIPSASELAAALQEAPPELAQPSLLDPTDDADADGAPMMPSLAKPAVAHSDAPYCMQCGVQMQRAGSCHACPSCGNTSGCS